MTYSSTFHKLLKGRRIAPMANRSWPGRPPRDRSRKISKPLRALVTPPVYRVCEALSEELDIDMSNLVRFALYRLINSYDKPDKAQLYKALMEQYRGSLDADQSFSEDNTWEDLRKKGLM